VHVSAPRVEVSPESADSIRLSAAVSYDGGSPGCEEYWVDFPADLASEVSTAGSPWLAWLLPLAVTLQEPLRIEAPVDAMLRDGAAELLGVWRTWYGHRHVPVVEAPVAEDQAVLSAPRGGPGPLHPRAARTAAFFSGGVDSTFTVLRGRAAPVDDLITIFGFDLPVNGTTATAAVSQRHAQFARAQGMHYVSVRTNLRSTRWNEIDWEHLGHGPALAGIALALETRYARVLIAATGGFRDLHPWASHPLTDPLLSSAALRIVHDGAAYTRTEKLRLIAGYPAALNALRVCWRSSDGQNCGECNKCYRTMLALELLDALDGCRAFPAERVNLHSTARVYCARPWDFREFRDIRDLALGVGRNDIAAAATAAMRRSRALTRRLVPLRALRKRGIGASWAQHAEESLLRSWIL
jgi:hypothetical protein